MAKRPTNLQLLIGYLDDLIGPHEEREAQARRMLMWWNDNQTGLLYSLRYAIQLRDDPDSLKETP